MSTTWKSLAAGFTLGVLSTGLYAIGAHLSGVLLGLAALAYILYQYSDRQHSS